MILYHGSGVIVHNPKIIKLNTGKDFGVGFYTTDIKEQAIRWAKRKHMLLHKNRISSKPVLNIYKYNNFKASKDLSIKIFNDTSLEWLDFVISCRSNESFTHSYDIVIGKIANDNVGETISYVINGIMRKEDAIERLKFQKINNQICFCTKKSLQYINFYEHVYV
jgi:hypothetical protein